MDKRKLYDFIMSMTEKEKDLFFNNRDFVSRITKFDATYACMIGDKLMGDINFLVEIVKANPGTQSFFNREISDKISMIIAQDEFEEETEL